jgi:hypothetical protein
MKIKNESEEKLMNYKLSTLPLVIGEWVRVMDKDKFLNGRVGYIDHFDFWKSSYRVRFTTDSAGQKSLGAAWVPEEYLVSINDERHEDDLSTLIDFALENNDKELFMELTSKQQLANYQV